MLNLQKLGRAPALLACIFLSVGPAHAQSGTLTTLHSFAMNTTEGGNPYFGLVQGADGNFYGTTFGGGSGTSGTVFQVTPSGSMTTLYSFQGYPDGANPYAGLILANDGSFYGTTVNGGANGWGSVFKVTASGALTTLYSFAGTAPDGENPYAGVVQGADGNFYGTTANGGANGNGAVYQMTPAGAMTILHSFGALGAGQVNSDGAAPYASVIQAADGNFYGTTATGGANGMGTFFKITSSGTFTVLHSFTGADGANPYAGVIQAADASFYGVATSGANGQGAIFRITSSGSLTVVHAFSALAGNPPVNNDGAQPYAQLMQGSDGDLYGATEQGGANGYGTIFKVTSGGNVITLHPFSAPASGMNADGAHPYAGLWQTSSGTFYGTTEAGGADSYGTVFSLRAYVRSDFNGDGTTDLVFQNPSSGQLAVWYMSGTSSSSGAYVTPAQDPAWRCVGDADFNGDGSPDLLFQNQTSGQLAVWFMNGVTSTGGVFVSPTPAANWKAVATADFNLDGNPDILFQNTSTGQLAIWFMNGTVATSGAYVSAAPGAGWNVVGTGDFNGDGYPDIVFQNQSTGQLAVWYMNGARATGGAYITPTQDPTWPCVAVIDLNGDGVPDLLFQNQANGTNRLAYWLMNGTAASGAGYMSAPPAGWNIVGPR